jgi:hypothetical protein
MYCNLRGVRRLAIALALAAAATGAPAQDNGCGSPFENHFGPFDYRSARRADLHLVERIHFTPGIESLTRPGTTTPGEMAGDVTYTLHVFPNHHRALITMTRLADRHNTNRPPGARYSVECYFERAVMFRPDDNVARLLYAQYLGRTKRQAAGLDQVRQAIARASDSGLSHYNIGLVALELGDANLAIAQAHRARELGYTATDLEQRLRTAGKWQDPPVVAADVISMPPSSAAAGAAAPPASASR